MKLFNFKLLLSLYPKNVEKKGEAHVIIADTIRPAPERHEIDVAWILAWHYSCTIEFLHPTTGYKAKTADIVMNGVMWEIKSPVGSSRLTIENRLRSRTYAPEESYLYLKKGKSY